MKRTLIIALLFYTGLAHAQAPSQEQRKTAIDKVYALYKAYTASVNLHTASRATADRSVTEFKALFSPGATIDDDVTIADTTTWVVGAPVERSVDNYVSAVGGNYKNGITGTISKANISFDSLPAKVVKIVYERNLTAINQKGYKISATDTVELRIKIMDDYSDALIGSVKHLGGTLKCQGCAEAASLAPIAKEKRTEEKPKEAAKAEVVQVAKDPTTRHKKNAERCEDDDDCDGVKNIADQCPDVPGLREYNGCPAPDPVRVGLSLNAGGGAGILSVGSTPSSTYSSSDPNTSYNSRNEVLASQPSYKVHPGGGYHVGIDLDLFFGKDKNIGISLGVDLLQNFVTADVKGFNVVYGVNSDGNGSSYTRILTGRNYAEKLTSTNVSIPILLKYQTSPLKPLGFDLEIGPVLSVLGAAATKATADLDFEAAYGTNNSLDPNHTLSDGGTNPAANSSTWLITQKQVSENVKGGKGVDDYFSALYATGRYVGLNQSHSGSAGTVKYNFGFGGMLRVGGVYRFNKTVSLLFGIYTVVAYNSHSASAYQPVTASSDFKNNPIFFQSFLNGLSGAITTQIGANIGIQVHFGKKEASKN